MRYAGRTGRILEKRGNAYVIEIKDGEKVKKIIASPIHLKVIE
jgi:large subunit ribosomal protein L21e